MTMIVLRLFTYLNYNMEQQRCTFWILCYYTSNDSHNKTIAMNSMTIQMQVISKRILLIHIMIALMILIQLVIMIFSKVTLVVIPISLVKEHGIGSLLIRLHPETIDMFENCCAWSMRDNVYPSETCW